MRSTILQKTGRPPRRRMLLVLAVALSAVITTLTGCDPQEEEPDPDQVLEESVAAMQALESFHFEYEVGKPSDADPVEGLDIVALEGDVTVEGEMEATIDAQMNGIPIQVAFVAVSDTHYLQFAGAEAWQEVPESSSPLGPLNLSAGTIRILERIQDPVYDEREEVDGVETYRLTGMAPAEDVEAIAQAVSRTEPFPAEIWVGVDDSLVHRIRLVGAATDMEPAETVRHITLSDFDEPVTIEPPQ